MLRKNSLKLLFVIASVVIFTFSSGFLYVDNINSYPGDKVITIDGQEFRETPVVGLTTRDSTPLEEMRYAKDRISMEEIGKLSSILTEDNENFGGVYLNDKGENVYLLKHEGSNDEKLIRSINPNANIEYVKYSEAEIREFQNILLKRNDLGVQFTFAQNNKIEILISKDMYEKNKAEILSGIDESIVTLKFGEFRFVDQAATIYPGEKIDYKEPNNTWGGCSTAFNASTSTSSKVLVTAGHCPNGTWYDLSDQSAAIGTKSSTNSNHLSGNYDGGYIKLDSSVNVSAYLNKSTYTIGTADWSKTTYLQGRIVYLHATSFGGNSSFGNVEFGSQNVGSLTDMVIASPIGSKGQDSGGLWYVNTTKNSKSYAMITGVHKGIIKDVSTNEEIYSVYSKFANVYSGLNLTSIYVDSTY